jgi:amino-acid N-acetyltransferase
MPVSLEEKPVTLRPAEESDFPRIKEMVRKGGINPTGLQWERFVVAEISHGEVIGCGQIKPHRDGSQELASIVLTPPWQGRGIARQIIEHLMASHSGDLYLMCRSSLGPFYEKFGFRAIEEDQMPTYFRRIKRFTKIAEFVMSDGEHLLVMHHFA